MKKIVPSMSVKVGSDAAPKAIGIGPMNIIAPELDGLLFDSIAVMSVVIIPVKISANPKMNRAVKSPESVLVF